MTDEQTGACDKPCCTEPGPADGKFTIRDLTHLTAEEQIALIEKSEAAALPITRLPGDE